ncbi:energy transducer TonB [Haloferula sp. BvORR071]|uniref:energy transducer TonB n=1 Tax=Haloferula sp. BvORR071 TaxID=1396141 RepID=UPI002240FDE5|nr:energy transducer TonB [Haloferula sp. BvORR071]
MKPVLRSPLALAALLAASCAAPEPPVDPNKTSYFVDVEYTIGTDGKTSNAKVINTDAPQLLQKEALAEVYRWHAERSADPSRARRRIEFAAEKDPVQ